MLCYVMFYLMLRQSETNNININVMFIWEEFISQFHFDISYFLFDDGSTGCVNESLSNRLDIWMIFLFRICTSCDVSAVAMMYKLYHIVHYCTCTDFLYCHLNHSMFVNRSHCYCLSFIIVKKHNYL